MGDLRKLVRGALAIIAGCAFGLTAQAKAPEPGMAALVGVDVLGADFATILPERTILIENGVIVAVGSADMAVPDGATVHHLEGKTVIPGLWDAHVHSRYLGIDHPRLMIVHGITTMRDLGGGWEHQRRILDWREKIASGDVAGPRIWTAATVLDNPGAGWSHIGLVHSPEEAREQVRRLKREGADFVKVYSNLTPENYDAIIDEASKVGLPVDGHVPLSIGVERAIRSGQRVIEHAEEIAIALADHEPEKNADGYLLWTDLEGRLSRDKAAELAALMLEHGSYLSPTLNLGPHFNSLKTDTEAALANPALRFIPPPYLVAWKPRLDRPLWPSALPSARVEKEAIGLLHEEGVRIIAGTDTVKPYFVPGYALHDELAALVGAGMSEGEVIRAATRTPAEMVGALGQGLIAKGQAADLLVLDASPLEDIANTRRIAMVVAAGRIYDREALAAMREDIAAKAALWNGEPTGR